MLAGTEATIRSERQLPDQHDLFGYLGTVNIAKPSDLDQLSPAGGVETASGNIHVLCLDHDEPESSTLGPLRAPVDQRSSDSPPATLDRNADVPEEGRILPPFDGNHAWGRRSHSRAPNRSAGIGRKEDPPPTDIKSLRPDRRRILGAELDFRVGGFNSPFLHGDSAQPAVQQLAFKNPIDQDVAGDLSVGLPALRSDLSDFKWHGFDLSARSRCPLWATL